MVKNQLLTILHYIDFSKDTEQTVVKFLTQRKERISYKWFSGKGIEMFTVIVNSILDRDSITKLNNQKT